MPDDLITDVSVWEPPEASDNFYQNFGEFLKLCNDEQTVKMRAQYLYSHILINDQWADAQVWIGPEGEIYESESEIPSHLLTVTSLQTRFPTLGDFTGWCEANVRGFSWTSYRDRHYVVLELLERGHDMKTATEYACYSREIPKTIGRIFVHASERNNEIVGINEEMAKRLPTLKVELDGLPEEEKLEAVKEAAREYDLEKLAALQEGIKPTAVSAITKREIERKPKIEIIVPYDTPYPYAVECTEWADDDTGYGDGKVSVVFIQLIDGGTGEILKELPPLMADWWMRRFGLGQPHGARRIR